MTGRVLRTHVAVLEDDGSAVVLRAGTTVPEKYLEQITNPRCYVDEAPSAAPAPAPPAQPGEASLDEVKPIGPDELAEHVVDEPADEQGEDERAPFDLDHTDEPADEQGEEPVQSSDAAPTYEEQTVAELRALLEQRGLTPTGPKRALVARLVAADAGK